MYIEDVAKKLVENLESERAFILGQLTSGSEKIIELLSSHPSLRRYIDNPKSMSDEDVRYIFHEFTEAARIAIKDSAKEDLEIQREMEVIRWENIYAQRNRDVAGAMEA
ncbi:hypothetical protein KC678_04500 [Candidatus Dojkabacteria bacterium]|uniref:Uncharacterized protein n=1 Tax=Candidatus Dojkabacteria bacterium TaxID=2099670 RepID=A0A955L245_9BACT|nr:hypothetical protein [Candidatus Dojkabacteria bacterium]